MPVSDFLEAVVISVVEKRRKLFDWRHTGWIKATLKGNTGVVIQLHDQARESR